MKLEEFKEQLKTEQENTIALLEKQLKDDAAVRERQATKIRMMNKEQGRLQKEILALKDALHKKSLEPKIVLDDTKKDNMLEVLASRCYVFLGSKGICSHCGFSELCPKHITEDAMETLTGSSKPSSEGIEILAILGSEANE